MSTYIEEAGWGIWPVFLFGGAALLLSALAAAVPSWALAGSRRALAPAVAVVTAMAGVLGSTVGIEATLAAAGLASPEMRLLLVVTGVRESLHCAVSSLVIAIPSLLLWCVGLARHRA
jgi:hypothetical protein